MAEKIISPGVFTNEIDQTFLPAAVADIGAAIIGPTVKGPSLVPTVISSYSEYQQIFGDNFKSGSNSYTYLTSVAAKQYLENSNTLTVVRILDGTPLEAQTLIPTGSTKESNFTGSSTAEVFRDNASSFKLYTLSQGSLLNSTSGSGGQMTIKSKGSNSGSNNILVSGSKHNLRWEVSSVNPRKGEFTLLIRRGDDSIKRKQTLETYNNVSLDPNSNNYIAKAIGDTYGVIQGTESEPYIQPSGSYPAKSKYVRVEVLKQTVDYLDENGNLRLNSLSSSLPGLNSGSFFGGSDGFAGFDSFGTYLGGTAAQKPAGFYHEISANNSQGIDPDTAARGKTAYTKALNLLSNQDEYDINMILMPGVVDSVHSAVTTKAVDVCEDRGDCFVIVDPVLYGKTVTNATDRAEAKDSNYAAMYWPWIQMPENQLGRNVWVPPSVAMGGIYAFNDRVAAPWFAPAGLNRGGIDTAIQAEKKLTQSDRDSLYDSNVNPIATFPGQGVTVFGQKTLQKKASALDRINVRRLLIRVKKFIASASRFLVFEQNTAATRRRFLNIANPFLEQVQSQSGLNAFRVVMDETNNTPDVVDRNQLYGQIFVQPTRTAEFIVLDFTIQPTGATFPE
jgi:uncharacterized protein